MQYLLSESEFIEYERLRIAATAANSDEQKLADYLAALSSVKAEAWQMCLPYLPAKYRERYLDEVDTAMESMEQKLLQLWREKDRDFFDRKLAWAYKPIDAPNDQAQNSTQLAAVNPNG